MCAGIRSLGTHDCAGGFEELSLFGLPPYFSASLLFPRPRGLKLLTATIRYSIMNDMNRIDRILRSNCKWREPEDTEGQLTFGQPETNLRY